MAITVQMRTEVSQLYVALFGRAPDTEGLGFWVGLRNEGQSLTQIANSMFATAPARAYFPSWQTNSEIIASFYQNVLGRTADAEGLAFWTAKLNAAGATPGSVITQMISVVANYTGTDPAGMKSADFFNNRVEVAQYYGEQDGSMANATTVLNGVNSDYNTMANAIAAIDNGTVGGGGGDQTMLLAVGQDGLFGGSGNDTFISNVSQNSLGAQVNTLGSGDYLSGGAGTDTLDANITAGVYQGGSGNIWGNVSMPIQPITSSIEIVKFEAVNSAIGGTGLIPVILSGEDGYTGGASTEVYVNAKDMTDIDQMWSWHSDANLTIQNLTTKNSAGQATNLSDMTIGMGYTGNADSHWNESDYSVYFDQDYLNPEISYSNPSVDIRLMNEDNYDDQVLLGKTLADNQALAGVYVEKLTITLTGGGMGTRSYSLAGYIGETAADGSGPSLDYIKTYDDLLEAVQEAIVELKAANPTDDALQTLEASFGANFFSDISPLTGLQRVGKSVTLSVDGTVNDSQTTLIVAAQDLVLDPIATTPIRNSNRYERADATPSVPSTELSINVALEKVGLAGDGGELIIGSMFKDGYNEWSDRYEGKGIAVFDVTVYGADDKPSSLSGLHSTGNNLRTVNVVTAASQTGTYADLTIGNSETDGLWLPDSEELGDVTYPNSDNQYALKDVQTFDASGFKGDLTLYAALTDEVVAKYMTVIDEAPNAPAFDNVEFVYTGGTGNDYINLHLDDGNFAKYGTTTREDFDLTINGGAGDDEIVVMIGDGSAGEDYNPQSEIDALAVSNFDNWYQNSAINANLNINGDAGNDTIRTLGSGNWDINAGSGADTVYADNTGAHQYNYFNNGKAAWVFNSVNTDVEDLLSETAASVSAVNAQVKVTFMGFEKTVAIANSVGATSNVTITDLHINQAIKLAINSDPVLSKLLVAEDGPARTLVVRSLIDGRMGDNSVDPVDNLSVSFLSPALSGAQLTAVGLVTFSTAYGAAPTLLDGYNAGAAAPFGTEDDYWSYYTTTGEDSDNVADNQIEGGTGNDVLVLGTGAYSNDTLVYEGFGNGVDSIVNFEDSIVPGYNGGTKEVVTLAFSASDGTPAAQTIIFDGVTVNLAAPTLQGVIPPLDVASQFVNQYNAAAATNGWKAVLGSPSAAVVATTEVATMTATDADADLTAGQTYTVAGLTYTSTAVTTQAELAAAFANLTDGSAGNAVATGTFSGALTGYSTGAVVLGTGSQTVTFTSSTAGSVTDLTDSGTGAAAATIAVTSQGADAVPAGATYGVTLTRDVPGAVTDLTAADFTGTYFATSPAPDDGNGTVGVTVGPQGTDVAVPATSSTFTVTYTTATTAVTAAGDAAITNPVSLVTGDGAYTAATKLAGSVIAGYAVSGPVVAAADGSSYSVTFVATAPGATAIPADTTFGLGATATDGVNGTFTSSLGVAASTTPPVLSLVPATDFDYIDFSSYDATGVVVTDTNQAAQVVIGTANGAAAKWITMTESTTNDGYYTINLVTSTAAGASDDVVTLIGVADFGYEQNFVAQTFIM